MIQRIRSGELNGAVLTSSGLSQIDKNILVLELPGVVATWADLARVRASVETDLRARFAAAGMSIAGWNDLGPVRVCTHSLQVQQPHDLRGKRVTSYLNDRVELETFASIGDVVTLAPFVALNDSPDAISSPTWAQASSPVSCRYQADPIWLYSIGEAGVGDGAPAYSYFRMNTPRSSEYS